uniref:Uncharacterized protein n=1 Tax=Ixodes ricinus TaxID=34613 RepID=A0A6B0UHH8_IXORI
MEILAKYSYILSSALVLAFSLAHWVLQNPTTRMSWKMSAAVETVTGWRDMPPYVTTVAPLARCRIMSVAFLPPMQFRASFGGGTTVKISFMIGVLSSSSVTT